MEAQEQLTAKLDKVKMMEQDDAPTIAALLSDNDHLTQANTEQEVQLASLEGRVSQLQTQLAAQETRAEDARIEALREREAERRRLEAALEQSKARAEELKTSNKRYDEQLRADEEVAFGERRARRGVRERGARREVAAAQARVLDARLEDLDRVVLEVVEVVVLVLVVVVRETTQYLEVVVDDEPPHALRLDARVARLRDGLDEVGVVAEHLLREREEKGEKSEEKSEEGEKRRDGRD